jgi:hypothetical protein
MTRLRGPLSSALLLVMAIVVPARSQEGTYDWDKARKLADGIEYAQAQIVMKNAVGFKCPYYEKFDPKKPREHRMQVLRIDTRQPSLRFAVTDRAKGWGEPMPEYKGETLDKHVIRTKRETTADFLRRLRAGSRDALVAVNAQPWEPFKPGVEYPYGDHLGLTISDGVLVSPPSRTPALLISTNGLVDMKMTESDMDLTGIAQAVSGFTFCLVDGEPSEPDDQLHPRTGYGLCRQKRYLVLLVVDGRQGASLGASVHEVGLWLRHYGSHTGINMDGGGSSTMVRWNPGKKKAEVLNRPRSRERRVGSNLAVYRVP